jgi:hypothetical protein
MINFDGSLNRNLSLTDFSQLSAYSDESAHLDDKLLEK